MRDHLILPEVGAFNENVFETHELDELEAMAASVTEPGDNSGTKIRRCKVGYVDDQKLELKWLFDKLNIVCRKANQDYFRFMLYGFGEQLQLLRYESAALEGYGWHQDLGGGVGCRKLSLSVQLSSMDDYEGGDLLIMKAAGSIIQAPRKRGTIIFFPSYQIHCVTPVLKGIRHALAGWIRGPSFR